MKKYTHLKHGRRLLPMIVLGGLYLMPQLSVSQNTNYIVNKAPLQEVPFTALPVGAVKAQGWLLTQLQLQKDGLTGNAEMLYNSPGDLGATCDWLGGTGDSWERAPYYTKGLVALAYTLGDTELIAKSAKWINWSLNSQQANGYFGPSKNNDWWARMPMLYAIRDYYEATNDARVIPFFTKYFQYQNATIDAQPLSSWGQSRAGDNIEIVFWLYNRTGDSFLLTLADKLKNQAYKWTEIFTNNTFNAYQRDFQPKHNVNVPQAMKMPAIYYQRSKAAADRDAYKHGHDHLMCDHGQPMGMQSGSEMLGGRSAMTGLELCSVVEQMQTSETAQMILGDVSIGDQLEKIAFNALPGAMTKDFKGLQYYLQANQVKSKFGPTGFGQDYSNGLLPGPYSGYGCCRFNLHMGWPYYVKTMWAATSDNGLAAMAYGPSRVTAKVGNGMEVTIVQDTYYPFGEQLDFTLTTAAEVSFPLKLRIPEWCLNPEVEVNGVTQTGVQRGNFYAINRTWRNNDKVVVKLPMHIQVNDEVNNSVSVQRGPLVYSLKISEQWTTRTDHGNGFKEYEVAPLTSWNYALVLNKANPGATIQVSKGTMPANPFIQASTPVTLTAIAKKLPSWGYAHNGNFACDPPYGPVETSQATEQVILVPSGAETLRATCLPVVGAPSMVSTTFADDFTDGDQVGWVNYNGSFMVDNNEYFATNTEGYLGSKSVFSATQFTDFTYDTRVKVSGSGDGGVIFRTSKLSMGADEYNGYYAGISAGSKNIVLGKANGSWTSLRTASMNIMADTWYQMRIVATGTTIKVFIDDMTTPKITHVDASFSTGAIGVRCYNAVTRWDNLLVTSSTTAMKKLKANSDIIIYPNPAKNHLDIAFGQSLKNECSIHILNMNGSLVLSKNRNKDMAMVRFDTQKLPAGTYLVRILAGNESFQSQFIKE